MRGFDLTRRLVKHRHGLARRAGHRPRASCSFVLVGLLVALNCRAELQGEPLAGLKLKAGLQAGFAAVSMINANLGLGQVDFLTRERDGDPSWAETHIKPYAGFSASNGAYGELSVVGAATFFDGDAAAFTRGGDGSFDIETALLGWRSGAASDDAERVVVDFSFGRQTLDIGDGFLIDDGNFDLRNDGGVWLVPRQAFQRSLVARIDYRALHSDLFFLEADPDSEEPALAGGNFEYQFTRGGHAGLLYLHILDTDTPRYIRRTRRHERVQCTYQRRAPRGPTAGRLVGGSDAPIRRRPLWAHRHQCLVRGSHLSLPTPAVAAALELSLCMVLRRREPARQHPPRL